MDKTITFGDVLELLKTPANNEGDYIYIRLEDDTLGGPIKSKLWNPLKHLTVTALSIGAGCLEVHIIDDQ